MTVLRIGPHSWPHRVALAPMAGVTDRPFRALCRALGAGYMVSEMVTSQRHLWASQKTRRRTDLAGEPGPLTLQIAGTDPAEMAQAARDAVAAGAAIVDINMGCPAKKVCNRWAGSALMRDEPLALRIVEAVVAVCAPHGVPVTLKMRTGWCEAERNAVRLARGAQDAGVALLAVHGRTREQGYRGAAEYATIAAVKAALHIPVLANGDIDSPAKAAAVLAATGADGVMLGRAALRRPWLLRDVARHLSEGCLPAAPSLAELCPLLLAHLDAHHAFYGATGVRSVRKHLGWQVAGWPGAEALRRRINAATEPAAQRQALAQYFDQLQQAGWTHAPEPADSTFRE